MTYREILRNEAMRLLQANGNIQGTERALVGFALGAAWAVDKDDPSCPILQGFVILLGCSAWTLEQLRAQAEKPS